MIDETWETASDVNKKLGTCVCKAMKSCKRRPLLHPRWRLRVTHGISVTQPKLNLRVALLQYISRYPLQAHVLSKSTNYSHVDLRILKTGIALVDQWV